MKLEVRDFWYTIVLTQSQSWVWLKSVGWVVALYDGGKTGGCSTWSCLSGIQWKNRISFQHGARRLSYFDVAWSYSFQLFFAPPLHSIPPFSQTHYVCPLSSPLEPFSSLKKEEEKIHLFLSIFPGCWDCFPFSRFCLSILTVNLAVGWPGILSLNCYLLLYAIGNLVGKW